MSQIFRNGSIDPFPKPSQVFSDVRLNMPEIGLIQGCSDFVGVVSGEAKCKAVAPYKTRNVRFPPVRADKRRVLPGQFKLGKKGVNGRNTRNKAGRVCLL